MAKRDDWVTCDNCEEEFRVINETLAEVEYCPFCGEMLDDSLDEDYTFDEE
jgi:Zn-finger nucleic acid-binding protein